MAGCCRYSPQARKFTAMLQCSVDSRAERKLKENNATAKEELKTKCSWIKQPLVEALGVR
jgi:hypothetical protein